MNNAVDRLSGLPSPLLDHILSLLPTKDVVRTCVLSKTWRNVWCYVPSFHFDNGDFSGVEADFVKFVDFALFLRDGSTIRKLSFTLGTHKRISDYIMCSVNKWIMYAIRHNVEVLEILNPSQWTPSPLGSISQIFTSKSLRELRLTSYPRRIKLPATCWLPSLKFLQFSYMEMTTFESSAFPSLETLIMEGCYFETKSLRISFPQLKILNFIGIRWLLGGFCLKLLEISVDTPNLISLKLEIPYKMAEFVEFNIISLVIANINLYPPRDLDLLIKLIRALGSVRSLTLCVGIIMAMQTQNLLSILARIQTPFYNMKWLKIQTCFGDRDIGMINTLLKHSSQLETLFLERDELEVRTTAEHCFEAEEVWFHYNLPHLKFVEIQGFKGSENEVKLTKFILKHALVLEKLIITTYKAQEDSKQFGLTAGPALSASEQKVASAVSLKQLERTGRNLFSSPRASQSVSILFI